MINKKTEIEKVNFDEFAKQYEELLADQLDFFGEENSYFAKYKIKLVKDTVGFSPKSILEFGCGIGRNLKHITQFFPEAEIYAADISIKSLEIARRENPTVNIFLLNEKEITDKKGKFDMIFVSCVFHHIKPELRKDAFSGIYNMLKEDGAVYIFEHNPYNPVTRHIVNTCPWDTDAILLNMKETINLMKESGLKTPQKEYSLFFPSQLKFLRPLENRMGKIPLGGQYYVKGVKTS
ncbi:MAG TPA: class I SAM-dependent methyltransferase [Ignavibacteria bacterium]|nr:class I SAM-dependent methyltransferase [Ignavibacteria bacterium]